MVGVVYQALGRDSRIKKQKQANENRHGTWSLEIYSPLEMANITNT